MKVTHDSNQNGSPLPSLESGKTKLTSLELDPGIILRVRDIAKRKCVTQASIYRTAIENYLSELSKKEKR